VTKKKTGHRDFFTPMKWGTMISIPASSAALRLVLDEMIWPMGIFTSGDSKLVAG
jgi:hypothetical protein